MEYDVFQERLHRHPVLLFPNRKRGLKSAYLADSPLDRSGIQVTLKTVVEAIGLKKRFLAIPYATIYPTGLCLVISHRPIYPCKQATM